MRKHEMYTRREREQAESVCVESKDHRTIEKVLLAISKGQKVSHEERKRATDYERNKRKSTR